MPPAARPAATCGRSSPRWRSWPAGSTSWRRRSWSCWRSRSRSTPELGRRSAELAELAELVAGAERPGGRGRPDHRRRAGRAGPARRTQAARLPEALARRYEDLRSRLGGIGAARLVDDRCDGCHLTLPSVEIDRIKHQSPDAGRDLRPVRADPGPGRPGRRALRTGAGPAPTRRVDRQCGRPPARPDRRPAHREGGATGRRAGRAARAGGPARLEPARAGPRHRRRPRAGAARRGRRPLDRGRLRRARGAPASTDVPADVWRGWRSDPTLPPRGGRDPGRGGPACRAGLRGAVRRRTGPGPGTRPPTWSW